MVFITSEEEIKRELPLQALYFYTTWMPFHQKFLKMIDVVEQKYSIPFYAIDVDFFKNQCKRFDISSIPSVLVLKDGKEIHRITGLVLTSIFKNIFNDICKN